MWDVRWILSSTVVVPSLVCLAHDLVPWSRQFWRGCISLPSLTSLPWPDYSATRKRDQFKGRLRCWSLTLSQQSWHHVSVYRDSLNGGVSHGHGERCGRWREISDEIVHLARPRFTKSLRSASQGEGVDCSCVAVLPHGTTLCISCRIFKCPFLLLVTAGA